MQALELSLLVKQTDFSALRLQVAPCVPAGMRYLGADQSIETKFHLTLKSAQEMTDFLTLQDL